MSATLETPSNSRIAIETHRNAVDLPVRVPGVGTPQRCWRGIRSTLEMLVLGVAVVLGWLLKSFRTRERLEHGLVLVLPGIEGQSCLNHNIVRGLGDAGVPGCIRIFDWTTRLIVLFLVHLRWRKLHQRGVQNLIQQIRDYRRDYPGRPIYLIGHSGGAAILVLALQELPEDCQVDRAILLAGALSADFNLAPALRRVKRGIWSFHSSLDLFYLGLGTLVFGTLDGPRVVSGGCHGFRLPPNASEEDKALYAERLHQVPFSRKMIPSFNLGGHLGCTNRVFVAEWVAPLIDISRPTAPETS